MPEVLQATIDSKSPSLLTASSTDRGEEEAEHAEQPGSVSAAAVAKEVAEGLLVPTSSSSQLEPTAVSVSVSVQDNPVGMSAAQPASAVNPQGRPTLLPHSSLPHLASTSSPGLLVPSVLRDLAAGHGPSSQPQGDSGSQRSPHSPTEVEHRGDTQATLTTCAPAGNSGLLEQQAPALESATTRHHQDPPPSEAGLGDPGYNLSSAISQQFESLPGHTPPGPKHGPHHWPPNRHRPKPQPKPEPEAATPDIGMQPAQDVPGIDPNLPLVRSHASLMADRLISGSFDRLGQASLGSDAAASEAYRNSESQLQPHEDLAAGQDNATDGQQQTQEQEGDIPMQAGSFD